MSFIRDSDPGELVAAIIVATLIFGFLLVEPWILR